MAVFAGGSDESNRTAEFSDDRLHRFRLTRRWGEGQLLGICMLNPSDANEEKNDPTATRCIGFTRAFGFPGNVIVNLFSLVATYPRDLVANLDHAVTAVTDEHILAVATECPTVIVAWGANAAKPWAVDRAAEVLAMLRSRCPNILCLGYTEERCPRHPLMLPKATVPEPYNP